MRSKGETGYFREEYAFNAERANCADRLGISDKEEYEMWTIFVQNGWGARLEGVTPDNFTSWRRPIIDWQSLRDASLEVDVRTFRREKNIEGWVSDNMIREAWMISRLLAVEDEIQRLGNRVKAYRYRLTGEIT